MGDAPKTVPNDAAVDDFVEQVPHEARRRDARVLVDLYRRVTGEEPRMWGPSIVGFGEYHYHYATGRQGDMAAAGFSPRAASLSLYFADGFTAHADRLARLGPHTLGKGCLYLKRLEQVDLDVLAELVAASWRTVTAPGFGDSSTPG